MTWNWLGWLSWILAVAFFCWVIHYIRVQQLMLIAKTKKAFAPKLFWRYVVLVVIALAWLGALLHLTFFRQVAINDRQETRISMQYANLQLHNQGNDYYYVLASRSKNGQHPVVSYTYWAKGNRYTTNSRFGSVSDGQRLVTLDASTLPWNKAKLKKMDQESGHAFAATMTVCYQNTVINGLGLRANRDAATYTLIRVPSSEMVHER